MSVANPKNSPGLYLQSSPRLVRRKPIIGVRMSVRPTTPAPSPFGLETHRPAYAERSANDNQKAVSGLQVTKASRDVVFDIEDLRGKLRLRRSLPPKF